MAEKTVILRPINVTIVKVSEEKNGDSWYVMPSDTPENEHHVLLSETEPDNNATYISAENCKIRLRFETLPAKTSVTSLKIHLVAIPIGSNKIYVDTVDSDGNAVGTDILIDDIDAAEAKYVTRVYDHTHELQILADKWDELCWDIYGNWLASVELRLTQAYLEITYDTGDPIYLRSNGSWSTTEGTIYQKVDGAWIETTQEAFQDGSKYDLVQLQ